MGLLALLRLRVHFRKAFRLHVGSGVKYTHQVLCTEAFAFFVNHVGHTVGINKQTASWCQVEVASCLEAKQKICGKQTKYLFRKAASEKVPLLDAGRKKLGFPVPVRVWLQQEPWTKHVKEVFHEAPASRYFDTDQLMKYVDAHIMGKADNSRKIWTVYSFIQWYDTYFAGTGAN